MVIALIFLATIIVSAIKNKTKVSSGSLKPTPKTTTTTPSQKSKWLGKVLWTIGIIIAGGILVFVTVYGANWASSLFEKKETPVKQTYTEVFEVPLGGTYKYLHPGWQAWPTKSITVVTPTGATIENTPGEPPTYPGYQPEGWYQFLTKEKDCQVTTKDVH